MTTFRLLNIQKPIIEMKKSIFLSLTFIALFVAHGYGSGSGHLAKNSKPDQDAMMNPYFLNDIFDTIKGAPVPPEIENPELLGINKEAAHATLMDYKNLEEALKAKSEWTLEV
jgi:hypothetical protein